MNRTQHATEIAAAAAVASGANKIAAAGVAGVGAGWLANSNLIALMGLAVAAIGMLVNWHYRRREYRLRLAEHDADMAASRAQRAYWERLMQEGERHE